MNTVLRLQRSALIPCLIGGHLSPSAACAESASKANQEAAPEGIGECLSQNGSGPSQGKATHFVRTKSGKTYCGTIVETQPQGDIILRSTDRELQRFSTPSVDCAGAIGGLGGAQNEATCAFAWQGRSKTHWIEVSTSHVGGTLWLATARGPHAVQVTCTPECRHLVVAGSYRAYLVVSGREQARTDGFVELTRPTYLELAAVVSSRVDALLATGFGAVGFVGAMELMVGAPELAIGHRDAYSYHAVVAGTVVMIAGACASLPFLAGPKRRRLVARAAVPPMKFVVSPEPD